MRIDWLRLVPALLLLLAPIGLFHGRRVRFRPLRHPWGEMPWREVLMLGLHTVDLLRATLGTWLLRDALQSTTPDGAGPQLALLGAHAGIFWLGTTLQTLICREPHALHAPFTFVCGIMLGYLFPAVGPLAVVLATAIMLGSRLATAFFPVLGFSVLVIGFGLRGLGDPLPVVIAAATAFLPGMLTLLASRQMVIASLPRQTPSRRGASPARSPLRH